MTAAVYMCQAIPWYKATGAMPGVRTAPVALQLPDKERRVRLFRENFVILRDIKWEKPG